MLEYLLLGDGDIRSYVTQLLLSLPIILLALSLHETAHGYAAHKLGDPTAYSLGRLTLNPAKHLDPIGFVCMVLFGFGWAKPVPITARYFKKPKRDMALTALAGPVSNLLLAAVFTVLLKLAYSGLFHLSYPSEFWAQMAFYLLIFLFYGIRLNVTLAIFNLIPVPPLDGSRILLAVLPHPLYFKIMKYENIIYIVLMALLFFGVLTPVLNLVTDFVMKLLFTAGLMKDTYFWYFI
ncbi:MAG: site-2 protease family protein [Clostridia bacterium]|nr:site-2 protease family protein [Clostridia bacterium]